jgi:hypothetical protein
MGRLSDEIEFGVGSVLEVMAPRLEVVPPTVASLIVAFSGLHILLFFQ